MTMPKASAGANAKPLSIVNWYIVGVLTLAYLFSYIDRQILSLMVGPIRRDLDITDTEFSLLHGLAFAVFYTFLGIPLARLADRANRRNIMAGGVAFWSVATMCCGLASNFFQLFSARIAVGVGEAALSPAAYSTLADLFPRNKLGRAISIYSSGVFLGIGLSLVIGGALIAAELRFRYSAISNPGKQPLWPSACLAFLSRSSSLLFANPCAQTQSLRLAFPLLKSSHGRASTGASIWVILSVLQ